MLLSYRLDYWNIKEELKSEKEEVLFTAVIASMFLSSASVYSIDINTWTDLRTAIENGESSINITNDITDDEQRYYLGELTNNTVINGNSFNIFSEQSSGIFVDDSFFLQINNVGDISDFSSKGFTGFYGPVIENYGITTIKNSIFSNNNSGYSSVIVNRCRPVALSVNADIAGSRRNDVAILGLENVAFIDNISLFGGAVINDGAIANISSSTFKNNSSVYEGGAIYNVGDLTINNSLFENNKASSGGAIYSWGIL